MTFRSIFGPSELIFGERKAVSTLFAFLLSMHVQSSQHHLAKSLFLFHSIAFDPLSKIS